MAHRQRSQLLLGIWHARWKRCQASFEQRFGAAEQEVRTGQTNAPRPLAVATAETVEQIFREP